MFTVILFFVIFFYFKVQRRAISDHVKRNTESHLKLACERLQELQASSVLTKASIKDEQTKMVTVMKKIKELSEGVIKSEALQVLLDNEIAAINKKLPKLQSKDDATDRRLSALQADAVTIKKEVKESTEKLSSTDETLSKLRDDVNELQDGLQDLRGVVCTVITNHQNLQEAITTLEKTSSRKVMSEIDYAKRELQNKFQAELRKIREKAEENSRKALSEIKCTKWELQDKFKAELRTIRETAEENSCFVVQNRNLLVSVEVQFETFRNRIISIFSVLCVLTCLYLLIVSIF